MRMRLMLCEIIVVKVIQMSTRTYSELIKLSTFKDRFEYLKLNGKVGKETFGFDRIFNQKFYSSKEWKKIRDIVITRDNGCDLGIDDRMIYGQVFIHHMNPILLTDIQSRSDYLLNPDYLICTSFQTHNAIHYGDVNMVLNEPIKRRKNDTCPWRHD